jgi:arylsulfatase G
VTLLPARTADTLIFLTGDNGRPDDTCDSLLYDNGFTGSNGPFEGRWLKDNGGGNTGKASTWEGGHREVGVFRWSNHIHPGVTDVLGSTLDITSIVLHLAGLPLPTDRTFDGRCARGHCCFGGGGCSCCCCCFSAP